MIFWLNGFPLPPSVNLHLIPVAGKPQFTANGKVRRPTRMIKSPQHRRYAKDCEDWHQMNIPSIDLMREEILEYKSKCKMNEFALRIECYFVFHEEQMWSKNHAPDADNRLKPCLDQVKKILDLDDVLYFASISEKVYASQKESECSIIRISPMVPRSQKQILEIMNLEAT